MTTKRLQTTRLLGFCLILLAPVVRADHFSASWLQSNGGIWEQDGVWSTSAYPDNGHTIPGANGDPVPGPNPTYDVVIGNPSLCTLGRFVRVQTVNVLQGSTLNLGNNGYLWANTGFGNAGLITLNSTGNFSGLLRASGNSNVVDGGEIFMSDSSANSVTAGAGGKVLTIFTGGRIRGAGNVNQYHGDDIRGYFQIVNHGLIDAMQPVNALDIRLTDDPAITDCLINDGTLRASGQGVLRISSPFGRDPNLPAANVLNNGGTIAAIDDGTVRLEARATVTGGTLATSGNGTIRGDYPNTGGGTYKDVVNTGTMVIGQDETIYLAGAFTNNGLVRFDGASNIFTGLLMRGASTLLSGNGIFAMNSGTLAGGDSPGQTAIVSPGVTIRGQGMIGTNNSNFASKALNVVNQGLIDATGPLTIFANTSQNSNVTNNGGTLRASNGGQLNFNGYGTGLPNGTEGRVVNSNGIVEALTGSTVRIHNFVTLEGGTLSTSGTGVIRGGTNGTGGTLKNVTNNGSVAIGTTETLGLAGTFMNNGSVSIDGSAQQNNTLLNVRDDVTLAGSGLVTMSGGYNGAVIASDSFTGKTLTVGPGVTIRGDGRFEVKLINQGTIEATNYMFFGLNAFLQRDSFSNGGILRAGSGSSIEVNGNTGGVGPVTFSNGGVIEARSGATIQFTGATSLTNYNAATQTLTGGTYFADGGTLNLNIGPITTNAATVILSGAAAQFTPINSIKQNNGTLVLDGGKTLTVAPGASARGTDLNTPAGNTFPNAGTIILGQGSSFTVNGDYAQGSDGTLEVVIGGDYAPGFRALNVTGTAALAGTLKVKLANGFVPAPGQTFPILNASANTGGFVRVLGANISYGPNGVSAQPTGATTALQMTQAVSRKIHGAAGALDIDLPLTGNPGIECRNSAGSHAIVFTFSNNVVSGRATVTTGNGTISGSPVAQGNTLTVNLSGVSDAQQLTLSLEGVSDTFGQAMPATPVAIKFLAGDTTGNSSVDTADIGQVKFSAGTVVTQSNVRQDVTVNGSINTADISLVKSRAGTNL